MAFALTWTVKFGGVGGLTNITSFMLDLEIDSSADLGQCGRSRATITLNNTGGQFTPNGSGTYASTDWLSQALLIEASTSASTDVAFVGMVSNVEVDHRNAKESTVIIEALDILTLAGSSPIDPSGKYANLTIAEHLNLWFDDLGGVPGYRAVRLPKVGGSIQSVLFTSTVSSTAYAAKLNATLLGTGQRVSDWFNTSVFPSAPATAYVGDYDIFGGGWRWFVYVVDRTLNKTAAFARLFDFVDGSSTLTSGQLPFENLHVGFQFDELINQSSIDDLGSLVASGTGDSDSSSKYGVRAYSATQTIPQTQTDLDYAAQFWGTRFSTVRYVMDSIQLTFSQVRSRAFDDPGVNIASLNFQRLCSQTVLWSQASVTYRAPGMASSATDHVVIVGRKVMASKSDTRIELTLKSGIDNQSFQVDSTGFGVLDKNRLG
jgi:hypothetical protein